jgi:protein-tyrosine phosphatase
VTWPDFGTPHDAGELEYALRSLLERARVGERVEVGCLGGHGRTGTALACLAAMTGSPPEDAVGWVREFYCDRAIETSEQEAFIAARSGVG